MAQSILKRIFGKRRPPNEGASAASPTKFLDRIHRTDRLIASYPRSGNTWLRYLIADVLLQRSGLDTSTQLPVHVDKVIPDLDRGDSLATATDFSNKRIIKTHYPWDPVFQKAIVIYRNPVDCLTSYFHFHLRYENLRHLVADGIDQFCLARASDWKHHLMSFHDASQTGQCNCHFLSYEALHRDSLSELSRALSFLGQEHQSSQCETAIANHQFAKHARQESPKKGTQEKFFRSGVIGSGNNELKNTTIAQLNSTFEDMSKLLKFPETNTAQT